MTRSMQAALKQAGVRVFPTLYAVRDRQDRVLVLVIAPSAAKAIQMCLDEGYEWAIREVQVSRIHKNIDDECGVLEVLSTAGGKGNTKNRMKLFVGGAQVEGHKPL